MINKSETQTRSPLVSIIVCSYNSAKFILETLESVYEQLYDNIELIITDDGSMDATLTIAKAWLNRNADRFVRTKLISVDSNTGTPSNCNRGIVEAHGEWIKLIAADDVLLKNCILDIMNYLKSTDLKIDVLQTSSKYYKERFSESTFLYVRQVENEPIAQSLDPEFQYHILKWAPSVNAPTIFFRRSLLFDIGLYDANIADFEDWPMWLKISRQGISIHSISNITVCYRINSMSASNANVGDKIYSDIYIKLYRFARVNLFRDYGFLDKLFKNYEFLIMRGFDKIGFNKNRIFFRIIFHLVMVPSVFYNRYRFKLYKVHKSL